MMTRISTASATADYLSSCAAQFRRELRDDVLRFWLAHGLDRDHGGIYTCLDRDGTLMDRTKSVWFQGRAAFSFAYAYNHVERRSEWLEAVEVILPFLEKYCFDPRDGRMYFEVTGEGTPLRKRRYVFSETFAIIAFAEYALATGRQEYAERGLALLREVVRWVETPGILPPKYLPSLRTVGHSLTMILINVAGVLSQVVQDPLLDQIVSDGYDRLHRLLYQPEYSALMEVVTPQGELIDTGMGRTVNPGHCIETAWFLMEAAALFAHLPQAQEMEHFGLTVLNDSFALGWDKEYGGIINFVDVKGFPHQDYAQDMKFWWPQTEGIVASLYAYKVSGDERYLKMFRQVHDWAYSHLPDPEYGEWYGYLHRDGTVAQRAKGNLFKGPFHIPRMLVKASLLCDEIVDQLKV